MLLQTGLQQYCPDMTFIPFGPGYTSEQNRVCTLAGSQAGQRFVDGGAYIQAQFGYSRCAPSRLQLVRAWLQTAQLDFGSTSLRSSVSGSF